MRRYRPLATAAGEPPEYESPPRDVVRHVSHPYLPKPKSPLRSVEREKLIDQVPGHRMRRSGRRLAVRMSKKGIVSTVLPPLSLENLK